MISATFGYLDAKAPCPIFTNKITPKEPPNTTGHFQVQNVLFLGYMMRIPIPPFLIPPFFNTAIFWPVSRVAVWGDYILI